MMSDKDLMRAGRYSEALGNNYNPTPYEAIDCVTGEALCNDEKFSTKEGLKDRCKKLGIENYLITNANNWL